MLLLGLVKAVHLRRDMLTSRGLANAAKLQMVGKMGDIMYARQTELYRIPRPDWSVESLRVREAALHPQLNLKTEPEDGAGIGPEATKARGGGLKTNTLSPGQTSGCKNVVVMLIGEAC
ncbi:hypothetical protein EVJ58_g7339 [Rhodofomes roseus]|uniref:Uncharacterized protein n=1 Tax=Rhodofomes roseus TaxID=34475 RepID=A0A4Y9Y5P8_9APHY|nr:hypothetical protein EVJ58_g7339 [Rhodofomes roseus]